MFFNGLDVILGGSDHGILFYGHRQQFVHSQTFFRCTDAPEFTARLAKEAGVHVDYVATIQMVDNYLPVFDMDAEMALNKHIDEQLAQAVKDVADGVEMIPEASEEGRRLHAQVAAMNRE